MMTDLDYQLYSLQQALEKHAGIKLDLAINDNRSTMLSVKWEPDRTRVSLHRMFLQAPENIMQSLACYLSGKKKVLSPSVKAYIQSHSLALDYSHELNLEKLDVKGSVYDLQEIYNRLNREYFASSLDLRITWFGELKKQKRKKITFGQYLGSLRLIKINRLLDNDYFPEKFISFVIYHEMLHNVCPAYLCEKGVKQIHNKEFKTLEKKFAHFDFTQQWMAKNRNAIFDATY